MDRFRRTHGRRNPCFPANAHPDCLASLAPRPNTRFRARRNANPAPLCGARCLVAATVIRRVSVRRRANLNRPIGHDSPVVGRVLAARGAKKPSDYSLAGLLPPKMNGLDRACKLLSVAIAQGRRIVVVGDYDADGATGTALAVRGLRRSEERRVGRECRIGREMYSKIKI